MFKIHEFTAEKLVLKPSRKASSGQGIAYIFLGIAILVALLVTLMGYLMALPFFDISNLPIDGTAINLTIPLTLIVVAGFFLSLFIMGASESLTSTLPMLIFDKNASKILLKDKLQEATMDYKEIHDFSVAKVGLPVSIFFRPDFTGF